MAIFRAACAVRVCSFICFTLAYRIDETLREHFRDSGISTVVGVAKHLCGGGSDVALRCVVIKSIEFMSSDAVNAKL